MNQSNFPWIVTENEKGMTLHRFLIEKFEKQISGKAIKRAIEDGFCSINSKIERFGSSLLNRDDKIILKLPDNKKVEKIKILFENDSYIAIDKWSGLVCEDKIIQKYIPDGLLIHRLDKGTSGVLLIAKDLSVKKQFIEAFRKGEVHKTYIALCEGKGKASAHQGIIKNYLMENGKVQGQTYWTVSENDDQGLYAETRWRIRDSVNYYSQIECQPITGRTHQIRVHLQSIEMPILGDPLYKKSKTAHIFPRLMLHAWKITIPESIDKKQHTIISPIPKDFQDVWKDLKSTS